MLTLKAGVVGAFVAGTIVTALVVGCSASGDTTDGPLPTSDVKPTDPTPGKKVPAPSGGQSDASAIQSGDDDDDSTSSSSGSTSSDGGSTSSSSSGGTSTADAGPDAGPPAAVVGASCSVVDQKYSRVCGHCGAQEAICADNGGGASALTVTDYGPCGSEHGVCSAGDVTPCGKCGTQTCGASCGWGSCKNEGVCKPGLIQHDTAGCPTVGTYRSKQCADTCSFGGLSACAAPEVLLPDVGVTSVTQWELTTAIIGKRPSSCKKTASTTSVTGFPIPLRNTSSTDAIVSIWHTSAGAAVDTVIATYADAVPATDDDFKACKTEPQDGCDQLPAGTCTVDGSGSWAGVDNVKVPANSTIIIYSSGWTATTTGKFVLNVKTKSH